MTLEPEQAADEIEKLAHAILVLDKALDRLWPRLPLDAMQKLTAIAQLEQIDATLAKLLTDIAEDIRQAAYAQECDEPVLEMLTIIDATPHVPHHGEVR